MILMKTIYRQFTFKQKEFSKEKNAPHSGGIFCINVFRKNLNVNMR